VLNTNDTGAGSLRDVVAQANANAGADDIVFNTNPGLGTDFDDATPDTIVLTSGEITFTDSATTTLIGTGANRLSVSGNNASRVFLMNPGASVGRADGDELRHHWQLRLLRRRPDQPRLGDSRRLHHR
jgi:hypothetical protein